jgi:hypothetical protein
MQSSPASCYFLPFRSKYSPQQLCSNTLNLCEIWGFQGGEDSSRSLLGCDAV